MRRTTNAIPYLLGKFGHACGISGSACNVVSEKNDDWENGWLFQSHLWTHRYHICQVWMKKRLKDNIAEHQLKLVKMTDVLDEPSSKKPKLSSPSDFDDDPLSELEKLEPLPSILETMSQTPSSVHMSLDSSEVSQMSKITRLTYAISSAEICRLTAQANNGPGPSSVGSTGATSQPSSVSHGNYMGPASVIQSQAGAPTQTHNAQSQQNAPSQPSVLQELLLNPSSQNNQTLNSPRPPYTTQYQTRSPVTSGATMMASANCPPNVALSA
ncbi:unnamed protein product, partial [Wuchereria bancrofti]